MPVPILDLKRQYAPLQNELLEALAHVLETQQFILGEPVARFERGAAQQLGVAHTMGCSSGTDALWLALAAAGIGPGDAVVTTPFSFFASVSAILRAGATPVLADIDPATFNLDPLAVEAVLAGPQGAKVKAILPVHLFGQCADWSAFSRIGKERSLKMIEDAAQAWLERADGWAARGYSNGQIEVHRPVEPRPASSGAAVSRAVPRGGAGGDRHAASAWFGASA